ncbi:MAG: hypothetical protein EA427_14970 [Spirochaetaceae bacterium]|nr:MAG: hypothetical protein EA427_14970 [Spirochaetaceae bacterium]
MYCYHLYTNPGLEDLVEAEAQRLLADSGLETEPSPPGLAGVTVLRTALPPEEFRSAPFRMIYQAVRMLKSGRVDGMEHLAEEEALGRIVDLAELTDFPGLGPASSIAVRCRRRGNQTFRSPALERAMGAHLVRRYTCPVNLTAPDVTVRIDITDARVDMGILATPAEMDRRYHWVYRPRVTLSPVTAQALLQIARMDAHRCGAILDPFCGSGTIPIEAASTAAPSPPLFAGDVNPEAIAGTRINLHANNLQNQVVTRCSDATDPRRFRGAWGDRGITTILCNPPYGVRLGRKIDFHRFYRGFLLGAAQVLPPGGRLVMMSSRRRGALNNVLATMGEWRIIHVRIVETGGVFPGIFLLERC